MTGQISGKEAMRRILAKAGEPLTTKEITVRALKLKGVQLKDKTPEATLAAILAVENAKGGIFERTAPGTYRLRAK